MLLARDLQDAQHRLFLAYSEFHWLREQAHMEQCFSGASGPDALPASLASGDSSMPATDGCPLGPRWDALLLEQWRK
eukprot:7668286-Alexandrium_andersonii.AAC.1